MDLDVKLGSVDTDKMKTDEDVKRAARAMLPQALEKIGEKLGAEMWKALQKGLGSLAMGSPSAKHEFIRGQGSEYRRVASANERAEVLRVIEKSIREQIAAEQKAALGL